MRKNDFLHEGARYCLKMEDPLVTEVGFTLKGITSKKYNTQPHVALSVPIEAAFYAFYVVLWVSRGGV